MGNKAGAATLKNSNIHQPIKRDLRDWFRKPLARELEIDAVLIVLCSFLLGGLFLSLVHAFSDCQMIL